LNDEKDLIHMHTASLVITLLTAIVTAGIAVPDFIPAKFVLANSAEVGVPRSWLPALGATKLAGAVGLLAGLVGLPALAIAAAAGLVLYFVSAVATHLRAHVLYNIAFPGAFLCLSAASLALLIGERY
jgi:DoxX-like family